MSVCKKAMNGLSSWAGTVREGIAPRPSPAQSGIDVHFHLFTINTVLIYALVALWDLINRIPGGDESPGLTAVDTSTEAPADVGSSLIWRLINMLSVWSHLNTSSLYNYLRHKCRCHYGFKVVPLMVDFAYCTDTHVLGILLAKLDEARAKLSSLAGAAVTSAGTDVFPGLDNVINLARDAVSRGYESIWPVDFYGQADQLAALALEHPDEVFPFLAVDPRRPDILGYVKGHVAPEGPFRGIKLYAPTGFSPTDPVLFGRKYGDDCLYRFCEERKIPITAHCATVGLAYLGDEVEIHGHIFPADEEDDGLSDLKPQPFCGILKFKNCLPFCTLSELVDERSRKLNDPRIWELVLERYGNLYLNLAHFGFGAEVLRRGQPPDEKPRKACWTDLIAGLMKTYPNLYTDLAGYANYDRLRKFKTRVYDQLPPEVRRKVMYGSDWDVLLYYEDNLGTYVNEFKEVFTNSSFSDMSNSIPRRFLFERP